MRHKFVITTFVLSAYLALAQNPNPGPSGGLSPGVALPPSPARANPLDKITSVTDAKLAAPPTDDWLTWRRTYDDLGFSPLKQITKANVANLRVAWSCTLPAGPNETAPLVHYGVIFVQG